jgi:hypothetical protein
MSDKSLSFPQNRLELVNGSILRAKETMPYLGLSKGQGLCIFWNGEYVQCGGLTWSVEKLCNEIERGVWQIDRNIKDFIN